VLEVPWVPGRARVEKDEHRRDGFAEDDGAGLFEFDHDVSVNVGDEVLEWGGTDSGAKAFGVVNVFDADGDTVERAAEAFCGGLRVASFGFGKDGVAVDGNEGLDAGLDAVHVGEEGTGVLVEESAIAIPAAASTRESSSRFNIFIFCSNVFFR
jgi:hypothetical protein